MNCVFKLRDKTEMAEYSASEAQCLSSRIDIYTISSGDAENSYALLQIRRICVIGVRTKTNPGKGEKLVSSERTE